MYVTEAARGRGIGRTLLQRLIDQAAAITGLEQIWLTVSAEQQAARRLYESLGFRRFGREPRALRVGGRYLDEEYFVLMLR